MKNCDELWWEEWVAVLVFAFSIGAFIFTCGVIVGRHVA